MEKALLFIATVFIWGTTWIAIALQVGEVPVLVSVFYRFALAGAMMVIGLALFGRLRRPPVWRFVIAQALCLFCFNFIGIYKSAELIPSGLVSVVFSMASVFNAVNARIIFGEKISGRVVFAGGIGVLGLVLLFWDDLFAQYNPQTLLGVGWAAFGTMMFSFGNMASRANSARGIAPVTANAWGMGIGAGALMLLIWARGVPVVIPHGGAYLGALVYLALIGSVVGFTTYLMLVQRVGSARAGYATVIFPVIALAISTFAEGYSWGWTAVCGVCLIAVGNIIMFARI